jgi:N-acetylmuramoyl-L-alanine amidase
LATSRLPFLRSFLLSVFLLAGIARGAEPEFARTAVVSDELKVSIAAGDLIFLFARPLPGEGIEQFVVRFSDEPRTRQKILELNRKPGMSRGESFFRVPYDLLSDNYKKIAIRALFPDDRFSENGWSHLVAAPAGAPESFWRVAEWFTGDGANYPAVKSASGAVSLQTEKGQKLTIPTALLLPGFRDSVVSHEISGPPPLSFDKDAEGAFALYRLQKGEALYSAVVVRFTGLVFAEEVNAEAEKIARRSGIADVHAIPVGFPVKIPRDDLLPDYRPENDPKRVEYERSKLEASQFVNRLRAHDLKGVTVVLDAGHGGRDTGALVSGVAESRYVYDIASRVSELLTRNTRARVVMTVVDPGVKGIPAKDRLLPSPTARVMTNPPYPIDDSVAGVHLRWYLCNSLYKSFLSKGGEPSQFLFLSIHADSLHPSVRGAMVYIPGEKFVSNSFGKRGGVYEARREFRQAPRVSFSRREKLEAEGISRDFAEKLVKNFEDEQLPVHTFHPIRENVIRGGRQWIPAVLRYNQIPARALLEVCNLNNEEDLGLIQSRKYRERVARGVVEAISAFYDGGRRPSRKS